MHESVQIALIIFVFAFFVVLLFVFKYSDEIRELLTRSKKLQVSPKEGIQAEFYDAKKSTNELIWKVPPSGFLEQSPELQVYIREIQRKIDNAENFSTLVGSSLSAISHVVAKVKDAGEEPNWAVVENYENSIKNKLVIAIGEVKDKKKK